MYAQPLAPHAHQTHGNKGSWVCLSRGREQDGFPHWKRPKHNLPSPSNTL